MAQLQVHPRLSQIDRTPDAWIDFDRNGVWSENEQVLQRVQTTPQDSTQFASLNVPADAVLGQTIARVRISSYGNLGPTGIAIDGEVEDHVLTIVPAASFDFGDAPSSQKSGFLRDYPVRSAANGARHLIGGPRFGNDVSADADSNPDVGAKFEELDEDDSGISVGQWVAGELAQIQFNVQQSSDYVNAWVDNNRNGDWDDDGEQIVSNAMIAAGATTEFDLVVARQLAGQLTFIRARVSSLPNLKPTGLSEDGEVVDLPVSVGVGSLAQEPVDVVIGSTTEATVIYAGEGPLVTRVHLSRDPGTSRSLRLFSSNEDALIAPSGEFVFNSSNWQVPQSITWIASIDSRANGDQEILIRCDFTNSATSQRRSTLLPIEVRVRPSTEQATEYIVQLESEETIPTNGGWEAEQPMVRDGSFYRSISRGSQTVLIRDGSQWQNPLPSHDVNVDQRVSAVDALIVINQISRLLAASPTRDATLPTRDNSQIANFQYYDVNGNNQLTALDALRVINEMARQASRRADEQPWVQRSPADRDDNRFDIAGIDAAMTQLF